MELQVLKEHLNSLLEMTRAQIDTHHAYMECKWEDNDLHGITDAANDLRELNVRKNTLQQILTFIS